MRVFLALFAALALALVPSSEATGVITLSVSGAALSTLGVALLARTRETDERTHSLRS